jgi:hypothetical protein
MPTESRQQRRARERRAQDARFQRVHAQIKGAIRIQDIWRLYFDERWRSIVSDVPEAESLMRHMFYTGCAAMLEMMQRVGEESVTEDQGAEILQRLQDELDAYANSGAM